MIPCGSWSARTLNTSGYHGDEPRWAMMSVPSPQCSWQSSRITRRGAQVAPLVAEEDDSVAEGVRLDQPQWDLRVRRPQHRPATSDHDGVHVDPVLVDQVVAGELRAE